MVNKTRRRGTMRRMMEIVKTIRLEALRGATKPLKRVAKMASRVKRSQSLAKTVRREVHQQSVRTGEAPGADSFSSPPLLLIASQVL
jgi:hypothetical protein